MPGPKSPLSCRGLGVRASAARTESAERKTSYRFVIGFDSWSSQVHCGAPHLGAVLGDSQAPGPTAALGWARGFDHARGPFRARGFGSLGLRLCSRGYEKCLEGWILRVHQGLFSTKGRLRYRQCLGLGLACRRVVLVDRSFRALHPVLSPVGGSSSGS